MRNVGRKLAFVLASSNHGTMIVNRFDRHMVDQERGFGVGFQILEAAAFDPVEVEIALQLLDMRRRFHGDGVVAIDCGANIGVHTIEWATAMTGWIVVRSVLVTALTLDIGRHIWWPSALANPEAGAVTDGT